MTPSEEILIQRSASTVRILAWSSVVVIIGLVTGIVVLGESASHRQHEIVGLTQKARRLDRHCAHVRGSLEIVVQDIVSPIPEVTRDPVARRKLAAAGVFMWNALADLDHVAIAPCLRDPISFGMIAPSPPIWSCAANDAPCAAHFASIALANFQPE